MVEALPFPLRLSSRSGLRAEINANGSLRRFDCEAVCLSLFVGNELEGGPANIYLRSSERSAWTPLLGPSSPTRFGVDAGTGAWTGQGSWLGIDYSIALVLASAARAWYWHVKLYNTASSAVTVDLTYAQDIALAAYGAVRMNEFYVSQYLDHTPLHHAEHGVVLASRQNQAVDGRHPWCLIGSLRRGQSFGTDALQFHGLATRAGRPPAGLAGELPSRRLQHEHSMVVIRDASARLEPGTGMDAGFFGVFEADHPSASAESDAERASLALAQPEAKAPRFSPLASGYGDPTTLFSGAPLLNGTDLTIEELRREFGGPWRHEELDERGERLSFFHGADAHVVLRAKELRVLRPHGTILRTGSNLTPDETALTSTVWMAGVFHSMVTQGHVSINRFLSTVHSYLGLFRSHGLRLFVELDGRWHLLHLPSAFEMTPSRCRWIYRHERGSIHVICSAESNPHRLLLSIEVKAGSAARFLISSHVAFNDDDGSMPGATIWSRDGNRISVRPPAETDVGRRFPQGSFHIVASSETRLERVGGDELLFADARSRQQPFLCIGTAPSLRAELSIEGALVESTEPAPMVAPNAAVINPTLQARAPVTGDHARQLERLADIAPWFAQNAYIHYLSPRGLEQFSGGGWGTRDVCQGPVELLLALGQISPVRDLLARVFAMQNPDGDWPQWFMFFDRERNIRPGDSHGDIVFWPLVVLAQYLEASGDDAFLDFEVAFFNSSGPASGEKVSVWEHAKRALELISRRVVPGTALAAYGHGDWNDSLQPADPAMRERMCSSWTVTLHFQALTSLAAALRVVGRESDAAPLERAAELVRQEFRRMLLVDGVLAGYALFDKDGPPRYLLHPRDSMTGVSYSSLAMIHAMIEDLFTPEECRTHLELMDQHLRGPDGIRLFDRPMPYQGGLQRLFQRAETATFFGREIGLMYMHAHLRYAQALAHLGESERFFRALCQANPIGIRSIVPAATLRQSNCYYSSSDAAFADRYEARQEYGRVQTGSVALDGGWRVYSSGAGIALGLIMRRFLGVSQGAAHLRLDPVIPAELNGLRAQTRLFEQALEIHYNIGAKGCGVQRVALNGTQLSFAAEPNPHRRGGARIALTEVQRALQRGSNVLTIDLG